MPCNCGRSNKQIYADDHIFTGSNMTSTLLGTAAQFCAFLLPHLFEHHASP